MKRVNRNKRVVFYLAVLAVLLLPFAVESGNTFVIVNCVSAAVVCVINAVVALWGRSKKEIEDITGLNIFSEE